MTNTGYTAFAPTKVIFGQGQLNHLNAALHYGKKALLVISNGRAVRANGALKRCEDQLSQAGITWVIFDEIQANPIKSTVMHGAKIARIEQCDFVVALGGGSVMDAAKAISAMATNDGDLWDYMGGGTGKGEVLSNTPLPLVCITTTAGTGSEVDAAAVITNEETNEKMGIRTGFPDLAVVDPELMLTVPPTYTAYQGFDALFHSTEVYNSTPANLMSDMVAKTAISNIARYLARAVKDGSDIEARTHIAFANTMSGYAMVYGACAGEHSLEHAMSAYHPNLPHGAGLIMISKAYYEHFISLHVCDDRFIEMARMMGIENADQPEDFITALVNLQSACGVENLKMSDYGITENELETFAQNALDTMGRLVTFERKPLTKEECVAIYQKSYR
ncbi:MAG: iron-containing alcohol dehydrogenase [Ruminococcus flavefaciens]|nr:iron-containing alcohol dehydrogenase [Ruminococcus flavefaciens]